MNPLRVFIVDDDRDFVRSLALLMERRGYQLELLKFIIIKII